jgi:hypothetical protein
LPSDPSETPFDDYDIKAYVTDDDGGRSNEVTTTLTVNNTAPVFTLLTNTAAVPGAVLPPDQTVTVSGAFTDYGARDVHDVTVDWGDGSAATTDSLTVGARNFTFDHDYARPGTFEIAVAVADDDGASVAAKTVAILNTPPVADAGGPYGVAEGGTVLLDASASFDLEQEASTLTFAWDLDGDGIFGETGAAAGQGDEAGISPTFSAAGLDGPDEMAVPLLVTDDFGETDTANALISIFNAAPVLTLDAVAPIVEGGVATLTGTIADTGTLDTFTLAVNWGDALSPDNVEQYTFGASAAGSQAFSLTHRYLDDNPAGTGRRLHHPRHPDRRRRGCEQRERKPDREKRGTANWGADRQRSRYRRCRRR